MPRKRQNGVDLLKVGEVDKMLRMSPGRIYAMAADGKIPRIKLKTGAVRFSRREIERWIRKAANTFCLFTEPERRQQLA